MQYPKPAKGLFGEVMIILLTSRNPRFQSVRANLKSSPTIFHWITAHGLPDGHRQITSNCLLIVTLFQRFTKKVNNKAKLWAKKRETEGGREWEQCALCADIIPLTSAITWTGLLTLRACWQPASIAAAQYTADKCWTTRRLQHEGHSSQALLAWYGSRVEVHSYYTTYACLLRTGQHLCVCLSYKQVLSVC